MMIKKEQWPVVIFLICFMALFTILFAVKKNYEFLIYVVVVIFFAVLVVVSNKRMKYRLYELWLLTAWAMLHMSGGFVYIKGIRLYDIILIPLSQTYPVFRYDQFVHIFGFFVATLIVYRLLTPYLKTKIKKWTAISIVIVMAGLGFGALNEIIEFLATGILGDTGVGDLMNMSLDLVADFIGALIGLIFIRIKEK